MSTVLFALACAGALLLISVAFQKAKAIYRRRRLNGLELRPNCLLTRHPIVFLGAPRSPFRLFDHWNDVPAYLREHGYDVFVIEGGAKITRDSVLVAVNEVGRAHLIADSSQTELIESLAERLSSAIASLTLVKNGARPPRVRSSSAVSLRPAAILIETFKVQPLLARGPLLLEILNAGARVSLCLHNFARRGRTQVDAVETADRLTRDWKFESRFLDLAISLAERDVQWCD